MCLGIETQGSGCLWHRPSDPHSCPEVGDDHGGHAVYIVTVGVEARRRVSGCRETQICIVIGSLGGADSSVVM